MALLNLRAQGLAAVLVSTAILGTASPSLAGADERLSPIPFWMVPVATDSGELVGTGTGEDPVYTQVVSSRGAPWIRVIFDAKSTYLAGPERSEGATFIRIVSMQDGYEQILNAETLAQWGHTSAYFNGDTVEIQVYSTKGGSARIAVAELEAGELVDGGTASICGPTDDRVASTDGRVGRLMPVGCTAWMFDGKPNAMLTAGHCFNGTTATVVQFNVPLSSAGGVPQNPPPADQYAVDPASIQWVETGIGNDWGHFGVFANSTTGLAPLVAQGGLSFARTAPGPTPTIRITGFGVDNGTANQTNQTHSGPFDSFVGTIIRYQADTEGGNSGSPVIRTSDGVTLGIHTNAGCFNNGGSVGGANQGTAFNNAGVLNAIANPLGIAAATTACGLGSSSCFVAHNTPHCNDAACCTEVCAADPFCCSNQWDSLCVNRAWTDCAQCGVAGLPCYQSHAGPGCEDFTCCQTVCTADPFCCATQWDSLCANSAATNCPGCGNPSAGDCCVSHSGPYCSDSACCDIVCTADPFCCDNTWDALCAGRASYSCASCVPTNDTCATAQSVSAGGVYPFGNVGATGNTATACGAGAAFNDVFFTYTASAYGDCTVSTCGNATFDTVIGVFVGTCTTGLTAVACSDDAPGCGVASSVTFPTQCGQTYTIVVGGFNSSARGTGSLSVTQTGTCVPANDNCLGASLIGPGTVAFSTNGATGSAPISCGTGAVHKDIWYVYVPASTGPCTLSTCNAATFDTVIAVFRGGCGPGQTLVACNDDSAGCGLTSSVTFDALCGQVYLIAVGGFAPSTPTGFGSLTLTPSGPPCSCPADLDSNGNVGPQDLARLLNAWGTSDPIADLNNDGIVGAPDLAALLNAWGPC